MRIINKPLLRRFAEVYRCEYCGCRTPGADPAHIFGRGAGRVDIPANIVSLCRQCHTSSHAGGYPTFDDLLLIAAKREGVTPEWIVDEVYRIRRDRSCKVLEVAE